MRSVCRGQGVCDPGIPLDKVQVKAFSKNRCKGEILVWQTWY